MGSWQAANAATPVLFVTTRVDPQFAELLNKHAVKHSAEVEGTFLRDVLSWVLPVLFFLALWSFFIRRIAARQGLGGLMRIGKSRAKV